MSTTSKIERAVQMAIEQDGKCYYCKIPFKNATGYEVITIEHKQPTSRGGSEKPENLCLACQKCNSDKGSLTEQEYMKALELLKEGRFAKKDIPDYVRYLTLKERFEQLT